MCRSFRSITKKAGLGESWTPPELRHSYDVHRPAQHRRWHILLVYPAVSVVTLTVLAGVWMLVFGLMQMTLALRLRRAALGS